MKLQLKLTLTLLCVSLLTAVTVGLVAYGFLMADFRESRMEEAFGRFQEDMTAYLAKYGTHDNGMRQEPFDAFVRHRRRPAFSR